MVTVVVMMTEVAVMEKQYDQRDFDETMNFNLIANRDIRH